MLEGPSRRLPLAGPRRGRGRSRPPARRRPERGWQGRAGGAPGRRDPDRAARGEGEAGEAGREQREKLSAKCGRVPPRRRTKEPGPAAAPRGGGRGSPGLPRRAEQNPGEVKRAQPAHPPPTTHPPPGPPPQTAASLTWRRVGAGRRAGPGRAGRGGESRLAGASARRARRGFRHVSDVGTTWGPRPAHATAHSGVEAPAEKPAEAAGRAGPPAPAPPTNRSAPGRPRGRRLRPGPGSREGRPGGERRWSGGGGTAAGRGPVRRGQRPAPLPDGGPGPGGVLLAELPFRPVRPRLPRLVTHSQISAPEQKSPAEPSSSSSSRPVGGLRRRGGGRWPLSQKCHF